MINDVIIIGGGAAGLCAAVYLKQNNPGLSVRILESGLRVGRKLALTGNGRCNITNKRIDISRYHGKNTEFCKNALSKYDVDFTARFFEGIGVPIVFEGDKGYPASFQASSVVDCLRFSAENSGVLTHTEAKVTSIKIERGNYKVFADNVSFLAKNLIIACGLYSGGERLGCDGAMLEILKKAGFKMMETTPAIVQIKTETDLVKQLKGIKTDARVTLRSDGKVLREDFGEVLFCDYGLSGPPIMQVSREASRTKETCEISLDILPFLSFGDLVSQLNVRVKNLSYLNLDEFFTGFLNKRLGQVILKKCGLRLNERVSSLDKQKIKSIASVCKNFEFKVTGTTGFSNSQVTAGGLDTDDFNPNTMMCGFSKGLYAVGEILDIDGDCGGFNLQWAWSSAFCAADSILGGSGK